MKQQDYLNLIDRFEGSSLTCLEIEEETYRIHLEKAGTAAESLSISGLQAAFPAVSKEPEPAMEQGAAEPTAPGGRQRTDGTGANGFQADEAGAKENSLTAVKAPLVGVFYAAPSPGEKPFVSEGSRVEAGQVLGLIEAMKMMNELKSPVGGIVRRVCGADGQLAEYGQILFEVEPC